MSDNLTTKDVFISYNKADETWVKILAEKIERETFDGTPNGEKLTVFFAPWDIEYGKNFVNELNRGLTQGRFFAPVMSPEFFASGWTNLEWTNQVALDPTNTQGKIIPLFLRDLDLKGKERIELPAPFNVLNRIDFRAGKDLDAGFAEIIRILRGLPKTRGSAGPATILRQRNDASLNASESSSPAEVSELLVSNLLMVDTMPDAIWSGKTGARKPMDVYSKHKTDETFILWEEQIHTFAPLVDPLCSLHAVLSEPKDAKWMSTLKWCENQDRQQKLIWLLNQCLRQHCYHRRIKKDEKGRFFFLPDYLDELGGDAKTAATRIHVFNGETKSRAVASQKTNPIDGKPFWVHYAARMRFELFDDQFCLRIEPTFTFTHDGTAPLDGKTVGKLAIQWTGKQQNPDVLRSLLFWCRILSDGKQEIRIQAGSSWITASVLPGLAKTTFGIGGDYVRIGDLLIDEPDDLLDQIAAEATPMETEDELHEEDDEERDEGK